MENATDENKRERGRPGPSRLNYPFQECGSPCEYRLHPYTGEEGCFCRLKDNYTGMEFEDGGARLRTYLYGECLPERCPPPRRAARKNREKRKKRKKRKKRIGSFSERKRPRAHCASSEECIRKNWGEDSINLRDHIEKYGPGKIYRYRCACQDRYEYWGELVRHLRRGDQIREPGHWEETPTYLRLKEDMFFQPKAYREDYIDTWNQIPKYCCPSGSKRAGTCTSTPRRCDAEGVM